jgi:hypothetical protein
MADFDLKAQVLDALANARENGFNIDSLTPEDLVADLVECDGDLSNLAAGSADEGRALMDQIATIIREARS